MDSLPFSSDVTADVCPDSGGKCQFLDELQALRKEINDLRHQVQTDALTTLYNYRFFSNLLPLEMERARRSLQPLSLILLDIDHFKQFNDRWGHELGNQALIHISHLISATIRKLDFACRFGGEEFAIILPNTDLQQAIHVAERLRIAIATAAFNAEESEVYLTASMGVDEFKATDTDSPNSFVERVDLWLYKAKNAGRNLVKAPAVVPLDTRTHVTADEKDALFNILNDLDK
jgi:diguanylate cyclase (GGDEF)-like protein